MNRRNFARNVAAMLAVASSARAAELLLPAAPAVRFSFMLWALEKQATFDRAFEIVADAGYQGIELTGEFKAWSVAERTRILQRIQTRNMVFDAMSGVSAGFAVPAESALFLEQLAAHLSAATALRCPQVILLSGNRVVGLSREAQRASAVENLKRAAEMAARQQIEIVIEPIDLLENPKIFMASVSDAFEIVTAVNAPNLKVLYDVYHEQRSFGNLLEKLERNIQHVGLIHIADVPGRHEPGSGEIDYAAIYRKLHDLRYDRWIAMEYYPTTDPVLSLKEARLDALKYLAA